MGIPHLDSRVAARADQIAAATTKNYVVDPVIVVLERLNVGVVHV